VSLMDDLRAGLHITDRVHPIRHEWRDPCHTRGPSAVQRIALARWGGVDQVHRYLRYPGAGAESVLQETVFEVPEIDMRGDPRSREDERAGVGAALRVGGCGTSGCKGIAEQRVSKLLSCGSTWGRRGSGCGSRKRETGKGRERWTN